MSSILTGEVSIILQLLAMTCCTLKWSVVDDSISPPNPCFWYQSLPTVRDLVSSSGTAIRCGRYAAQKIGIGDLDFPYHREYIGISTIAKCCGLEIKDEYMRN